MSAAEVTAMQQLETRIVSERSPFVVFTKGQVQITLNEYVPPPPTLYACPRSGSLRVCVPVLMLYSPCCAVPGRT